MWNQFTNQNELRENYTFSPIQNWKMAAVQIAFVVFQQQCISHPCKPNFLTIITPFWCYLINTIRTYSIKVLE